ncbi:MAG: tetratricopeptide repeat protein [Caldilineaceae bacterium]|nr:tetratricopeptide repeat protein [Caldilineaceae bacterium]
MLSFTLLGEASLYKGDRPLNQFRSQKEAALLIYLAHTGQTHRRDFIAELLWEDRPRQQALTNLRTLLTRLRKQVGDALVITRQTIALTVENRQAVDSSLLLAELAKIRQVNAAETAIHLQNTLSGYHGDFLVDFYLPDAPAFDEWTRTTREHIRRQVIDGYHKLEKYALAANDAELGIAIARRWIEVDSLDEAAHMLLIQLLLKGGNVHEARIQYEYCADLLRRELDVEPPAEMAALLAKSEQSRGLFPRAHTTRPHNLPAPHDQFLDRLQDQQEIHARLDQPWCRLLTIVGLGGVGKTRLATAISRSRLGRYRDGAWLVELADIDPDDEDVAEAVVVEIATALDLRLSGSERPTDQLLAYLQHKEMLLVLDNFEHLLAGIAVVQELLRHCERVQLLITSREALQLSAEWTITLHGLNFPASDDDETPADAVKLFMARLAQYGRSQQYWQTMTDDERAAEQTAVRRICRLAEGLPLAIELAAALAGRTSARAVAESLRQGFDTLTATLRDVPQRHRGLHIVYEMSWRTLSPALQQRLARLSVFRGSFTGAAALEVADADACHLAAFIAKSLLTYIPAADRYTLHPVIQSYAATKRISLSEFGVGREPIDPVRLNHARYYLTLLAQQKDALWKGTLQAAAALLQADIDNVRLAWQTELASLSSTSGEPPPAQLIETAGRLSAALAALSSYYQLRGLALEGESVMQATAQAAASQSAAGRALAAHAGLERARFQNRLGRYQAAVQTVDALLPLARQGQDRWVEGMAHVLRGEALWRMGEYDAATDKLNEALDIARALQNAGLPEGVRLIGWCRHHLGVINDIQSRYDAAHDDLQQACRAWQTLEHLQALSGSLNSIGLVCYHQGDLPAAQEAMDRALALSEQLDDRHRQSTLLSNLSMIATERGDYTGAHRYLQRGLELATTSGNLASQGEIYGNLGKNYCRMGEIGSACENLERALQIAELIGNRPLATEVRAGLAEIRDY